MRHKLLFQLIVTTALAKSSSKKRPKQGEIKHPAKRKSAYVVTPNTTRVVVLKMPHSGSTWFAALLNRFPRTFVREESITKTRSNNVNPEAIRRHVGTSLARPTDKMVASRNGKHAYSPRAKHFDCGGCELAVLGRTMCPMCCFSVTRRWRHDGFVHAGNPRRPTTSRRASPPPSSGRPSRSRRSSGRGRTSSKWSSRATASRTGRASS